MTDESSQLPPEPTEEEMGSPIGELADIRVPASTGFFGRVRGSIERRRLGSDLTDLSWNGLISVVLEFIDLAAQMIAGPGDKGKRR